LPRYGKKQAKPFPQLNLVDELVEFFDNDIGDYWDRLPKADFEINIRIRKHLVVIGEPVPFRVGQPTEKDCNVSKSDPVS
jgi:hypothetical protein